MIRELQHLLICVCVSIVVVRIGFNCVTHVAGFFPFGERNGDDKIPQAIDKITGPISLPEIITFFQKKEHSYYVGTKNCE